MAKALREVTRWWDGLTDYHAKYLAYELTKRCASDNVEKLASVLYDSPAAMHTGEWESPQVRRSEAQKRNQGASGSGYVGAFAGLAHYRYTRPRPLAGHGVGRAGMSGHGGISGDGVRRSGRHRGPTRPGSGCPGEPARSGKVPKAKKGFVQLPRSESSRAISHGRLVFAASDEITNDCRKPSRVSYSRFRDAAAQTFCGAVDLKCIIRSREKRLDSLLAFAGMSRNS